LIECRIDFILKRWARRFQKKSVGRAPVFQVNTAWLTLVKQTHAQQNILSSEIKSN